MIKRFKNYVDTNEDEDEMSSEYSDNQPQNDNHQYRIDLEMEEKYIEKESDQIDNLNTLEDENSNQDNKKLDNLSKLTKNGK
jgi:hypothetical protein